MNLLKQLNVKLLPSGVVCTCVKVSFLMLGLTSTWSFKRTDTLSREATLSICFCLPSDIGSTLKGKNLLLLEAKSFL